MRWGCVCFIVLNLYCMVDLMCVHFDPAGVLDTLTCWQHNIKHNWKKKSMQSVLCYLIAYTYSHSVPHYTFLLHSNLFFSCMLARTHAHRNHCLISVFAQLMKYIFLYTCKTPTRQKWNYKKSFFDKAVCCFEFVSFSCFRTLPVLCPTKKMMKTKILNDVAVLLNLREYDA